MNIDCNNFCYNHGICEINDGQFRCTCMPGWTGNRCGIPVTTTTVSTSSTSTIPNMLCNYLGAGYCNSGTCVVINGGIQCQCPPNYTGSRCESPVIPTLDRM